MRGIAAFAFLFAVATANSRAADEHRLLSAPLASTHDRQLSALTVIYAPGQVSPPHRHGGDAFVYVLSGHVRSQVDGGAVRVYGPGESWFEPAGAHHVVCGNASTTQSASFLVVFVAPVGATLTTWDRAGGQSSPAARTQSR